MPPWRIRGVRDVRPKEPAMNRSRTLAIALLAFCSLLSMATAARKPNIVFILADDLGWRDLSNEGSQLYESPHIDRIAAEG
jgi:hypothetical protein